MGRYSGHHDDGERKSVFYCRAEWQDKNILLGNLQIDAPRQELFQNTAQENILLRRRNLYRTMVQEALKHAVSAGAQKIIFQAGSRGRLGAMANKRHRKKDTNHQGKLSGISRDL